LQGDQAVVSDEIARLEIKIDDLARSLEKCRKAILVSKLAIAAGGLWAAALFAGALGPQPLSVIGAITAVIGGIVGYGSNSSTARETLAAMKAAEALRAELIGSLDLRPVDGRDTEAGSLSILHRDGPRRRF
jgi:hypothetical protein